MAEIVYPPVVLAAKTMFRVLDNRLRVTGTEHVPRIGGAVIACNHVSYLDFIFCGLGAQPAKRLVRSSSSTPATIACEPRVLCRCAGDLSSVRGAAGRG